MGPPYGYPYRICMQVELFIHSDAESLLLLESVGSEEKPLLIATVWCFFCGGGLEAASAADANARFCFLAFFLPGLGT